MCLLCLSSSLPQTLFATTGAAVVVAAVATISQDTPLFVRCTSPYPHTHTHTKQKQKNSSAFKIRWILMVNSLWRCASPFFFLVQFFFFTYSLHSLSLQLATFPIRFQLLSTTVLGDAIRHIFCPHAIAHPAGCTKLASRLTFKLDPENRNTFYFRCMHHIKMPFICLPKWKNEIKTENWKQTNWK